MPAPGSKLVARAGRSRGAPARTAFAVVVLLLAFAQPARAGDAWSRLRVPARAIAGTTIEIALPDPPADVDEFEVLLSLDDGRTYPVRVTPELAAGERTIRWQVPAFAAGAARLRLRYRQDERERDGAPSDPFEIVAPAGSPDLRVFHECGWWEGLDAGGAALPAGWGRGDAPGWSASSPAPVAGPPAAPAGVDARVRLRHRGGSGAARLAPEPVPARPPFERCTALRN